MPSGRSISLSDFEQRLILDGRGYVLRDGLFNGMNYKVSLVCPTHSEIIWEPLANNVINKKSGCPTCAKNTKITEQEFMVRLVGNSDVTYISDFTTTQNYAKFSCTHCSHIWEAKPNNILNGTRCIKCFGAEKLTNALVDARLFGESVKRIGEYTNIADKIKYQCCNCGLTFSSSTNNIFFGNRCPSCADYGFSYEKPAYLYYAKISNMRGYYKVGITKRKPSARLKESSTDFSVLFVKSFKLGREAYNIEQSLLHKFKHLIQTEHKFSGSTECFTEDIRNHIDLDKFVCDHIETSSKEPKQC